MTQKESAPCRGREHHGPTLSLSEVGDLFGEPVAIWACDTCGAKTITAIERPIQGRSFWERVTDEEKT